ncbi:TerB N-terminal domain-containing protein [Tahibacter aquaticus]|uniref:tellurite resistance TerB family protein n=1 Tax=Tahibacter aquaticus TaxID=520092 RepID=UPI001414FAD9|nr:TerB N-terminal domain-containing protein [Tahibacter aquaticus]
MPEGETVTVAGISFNGGLIYFGDPARNREFRDEPAVIDPTLAVDRQRVQDVAWSASYWPRYDRLLPTDRTLFLNWLSHGRADGSVAIGIVFLFYYGIERRILVDAVTDPAARAEVPRLLAEVDRLRRIYVHSAFHDYSGSLRDLAIALYGNASRFRATATLSPGNMPTGMTIVLGRLVGEGQALPAVLAFDWARCLDDAPRQSAFRLVEAELEALFIARYTARYPTGLVISAPKRQLSIEHRGAAGNRIGLRLTVGVPDVRGISAPQRPLLQLLQACLEDLGALVRVRKRERPTALEVAAALPAELRGSGANEGMKPLYDLMDGALKSTPIGVFAGDRLLTAAGVLAGQKWGKRECTALLSALDSIGIGVEPDVRFDGPIVDATKSVAVFRLPDDAARSPSANYRMGQLLLQLAVAVAAADGELDEREMEEALQHLDRLFALEPTERLRLQAHLAWLESAPPSLAKLSNRLKSLPPEPRRALADVVVGIAAADGRIDPAELRTLEKVYRALGLDAATLPADVHRVQTGVAPRPMQPTTATKPQGLDVDAIAAKLKETAEVQRLLSSIFVEDSSMPLVDAVTPSVPTYTASPIESANLPIAGLDAAHSTLLRQLLAHSSDMVDRADVERWCDPLGLLPDGALESVNEAAYSVAGDALLEVDECISIRSDIRDILTRSLEGVPA